ncbi:hypothetical protein BMF94_6382 [Rhodotorula taiwanensis]|uniref:[histone H3]-trimethyl-L-lysine(4) demethylase n=1 Tax=Rhodotorula taiwanensis TaxID=741276 RepID=A0A2S5B1D3_9BASI|nr:hypothetical protein BMF94_6382 [Rhodotorula taiwanensis]
MVSPPPPPATFFSALDIVFSDDENGQEIAKDESRDVTPTQPDQQLSTANSNSAQNAKGPAPAGGRMRAAAPTGGRMSVRASKATALAAMQANAKAAAQPSPLAEVAAQATPPPPTEAKIEPKEEEIVGPHPSKNSIRRAVRLPTAPPLDFSTIRMAAPRHPNPPPREKPRMFELEEAPVYHPSIEEFSQPMEYIEKIAKDAKQYGICKIVPPEGWRPPFAIDTETFRFKTRLQQLNSLEASARASLNFLEQLYLFHRQQGSSGITIPNIGGKPVDMWKLKREVGILGGYQAVTNARKWTIVGKALGYNVTANTGICSQLKMAYFRIIVPFEEYVKHVKLSGGPAPPDPVQEATVRDTAQSDEMKAFADKLADAPQMDNGSATLNTPVSENGSSRPAQPASDRVRTASDKLNEALDIKSKKGKVVQPPGESCEICNLDHDPDRIVLCEECDRGYHLSCLSPPLKQVPTAQFYCDKCLLLNGADYGFEEGQDHSLYSFRRRADAFKRKWLETHPMPESKGKQREGEPAAEQDVWAEQLAIEDHFEREFWRLVEAPTETVEVEYGADVASTKDGAGFPNLEVHPLDPYSRDGWNLNNLPILAGSLLRYVKSDISGMTIPWIYVGMVFSTFAWHKEDHYSYSINYHHLGDTKTWYGIPGEDDEKLEAAVKLAAPELFEQQPDLMFQLVTLMSPGRLKKHGVRCYVVDQRPNEFIITFPRAYHSGFNHGFNFNEAVNFALADWLPEGLRCIERYREIKKNPVFSHDELLVTISQWERDPRTSRWLLPHVREMVSRELEGREVIRAREDAPEETVDPNDRDEEEYQCQHCRVLCYLSQIVSADGKHIACLDHMDTLPAGPKLLRVRFTDADLAQLSNRVNNRAQKMGRQPDPATGLLDGMDAPRSSGRKRKPSAALLEAAGETAQPAAQRVKSERYSDEDDEDDDDDDVMHGNGQQSPSGGSNGHYGFAPPPQSAHANGDIDVGTPQGHPLRNSMLPASSSSDQLADGQDIVIDPGLYSPAPSATSAQYASYPEASNGSALRFSPPRAAGSATSIPVQQEAWNASNGWHQA